MTTTEVIGLGVLALIIVLLIVLLARRGDAVDLSPIDRLEISLGDRIGITQLEVRGTRDDVKDIRERNQGDARDLRKEMNDLIATLGNTLRDTQGATGKVQVERLDAFAAALGDHQRDNSNDATKLRKDLVASLDSLAGTLSERLTKQASDQGGRLDGFGSSLTEHRSASLGDAKLLREEVGKSVGELGLQVVEKLALIAKQQKDAADAIGAVLKEMSSNNEKRQDALRQTVESRLETMRAGNEKKLDEMRATVDEKLQGTLTARLGESFGIVNDNLDRVAKSVGEMQALATGVGDLKRVLSNIKVRGTWGEGNLGSLLEQVLTPEQYSSNVAIKPHSNERVEFAIKLPGDNERPVWLPIDSKLPMEDYERLIVASEAGDAAAVDAAGKGLERAIVKCSQDISSKYIEPPFSTDIAVMFLPTEGLFAEVVRRPGLIDRLQRECRVIVTGPTTLMALLSSLRMGFRTLAIQERSSEVWQVLSGVKTEFGKFGPMLDKVAKKLGEAQNVVAETQKRNRVLTGAIKRVETLPQPTGATPIQIAVDTLIDEDEELDSEES